MSRPGGCVAGCLWFHNVPSHSHVEVFNTFEPSIPPNSTETRLAESYAIAAPTRPGGEPCGARWTHVKPSHSQVSEKLAGPVALPPSQTVTRPPESYAVAEQARASGPDAAEACHQFN